MCISTMAFIGTTARVDGAFFFAAPNRNFVIRKSPACGDIVLFGTTIVTQSEVSSTHRSSADATPIIVEGLLQQWLSLT